MQSQAKKRPFCLLASPQDKRIVTLKCFCFHLSKQSCEFIYFGVKRKREKKKSTETFFVLFWKIMQKKRFCPKKIGLTPTQTNKKKRSPFLFLFGVSARVFVFFLLSKQCLFFSVSASSFFFLAPFCFKHLNNGRLKKKQNLSKN